MTALAPSGEFKRDVALHILGAIGLITVNRADELAMVYGDSRGSVNIRARRGETHIESLLDRFYSHTLGQPATSDIITQLEYVATGYHRRRMLVIVVSDEPDANDRLHEALQQLTGRHDLMWAMVSDMAAVGSADGERDGYDVATGGYVLNGATLGPRIIDAYRRREATRVAALDEFLTIRGIGHTSIAGSQEIRDKIVAMTEAFEHAG